MKKKKKNTEQIENTSRLHTENQIKRHNEKLKLEKERKEKKLNDIFRKKVRDASEKKAVKTERTKAYYRFSKDFPSEVDTEGFRANSENGRKLSPGKKIILLLLCIFIFVLTFVGVRVCINLSEIPLPPEEIPEEKEYISALHIKPEELRDKSPEEITALLEENSCNTAVFEFKDDRGYVYFDTGSHIGTSADRVIYDAAEKISAVKEAGYATAAYISCFRDTCAGSVAPGFHVRSSEIKDNVFYDSEKSAWLDPSNPDASSYILGIIGSAAGEDFTYIILDNISFPAGHQNDIPLFSSDISSPELKNNALGTFIASASEKAGKDRLIVMSDIASYSDIKGERYGGSLISENCTGYAFDGRIEKQHRDGMQSSELLSYIDEMPSVFILDAGKIASTAIKEKGGRAFAVTDRADFREYALLAGFENIILW